jgi:hypothetical protein
MSTAEERATTWRHCCRNFPAVLVRDDWLLSVVAVRQVQMFLYQLFAESNKPAPPTGPKQWSFKLTFSQRQVLSGLPAAAPSPESVLAAREATFAVFFREAPPIAAQRHPLAVRPGASHPGLRA